MGKSRAVQRMTELSSTGPVGVAVFLPTATDPRWGTVTSSCTFPRVLETGRGSTGVRAGKGFSWLGMSIPPSHGQSAMWELNVGGITWLVTKYF